MISFVNAWFGGRLRSLRIAGSRIAAVDEHAQPGDRVVDLRGCRLLPGLINGHDHLQLNGLSPLRPEKQYRHVTEWIADINARRRSDRDFEAQVRIERNARLAVGGIKNLLSGVTTVAHHDPRYPFLIEDGFPTQIVADYGWTHSLYIDGEDEVRAAYRRTPPAWPWIVHAAEGVDVAAGDEFEALDRLGCVGSNTLLVHGMAVDRRQLLHMIGAGAGLVCCPSSNLRLFGRTAEVADLVAAGRVALGTDSRLSGARDLFEELRLAAAVGGFDEPTLESLVTRDSARLLRTPDRGALRPGLRADLLILPEGSRLSNVERADVCLVVRGGRACYGDKAYADAVAPAADWVDVQVDGRPKVMAGAIAGLLQTWGAAEPGLEFPDLLRAA